MSGLLPACLLSGVLNLLKTDLPGSNVQFAVYSGTCGAFSEIHCQQLTSTFDISAPELAGETIYIRAFNYNSEEGGSFTLCLKDPVVTATLADHSPSGLLKRIYPAPAQDMITVEVGGLEEEVTAFIYSVTGTVVMEVAQLKEGLNSLQLQNLQPGTYILRLKSDTKQTSAIFIKE